MIERKGTILCTDGNYTGHIVSQKIFSLESQSENFIDLEGEKCFFHMFYITDMQSRQLRKQSGSGLIMEDKGI